MHICLLRYIFTCLGLTKLCLFLFIKSQKLHLVDVINRMSAVTGQSNYKKDGMVVDSKSLKDIAVNEVT